MGEPAHCIQPVLHKPTTPAGVKRGPEEEGVRKLAGSAQEDAGPTASASASAPGAPPPRGVPQAAAARAGLGLQEPHRRPEACQAGGPKSLAAGRWPPVGRSASAHTLLRVLEVGQQKRN